MTDKKPDPKGPHLGWLVAAICLVIALWITNFLVLRGVDDGGRFGDMFGAVNAFFSGCAFAVLIFTLWLQRTELALQRRELQQTRHELKGQRGEMKAQADTLRLQQFENTFFQLLRVHRDNVESTRVGNPSVQGRHAIRQLFNGLRNKHADFLPARQHMEPSRTAIEAYEAFYEENEVHLGHYFMHLYHIIKFVDQHTDVDQLRYRSFLRAQLSAYELGLLFYDGISVHGNELKPLIEKYALLKHLPTECILDLRYKAFYAPSAFMATQKMTIASKS
jgi:hypothetical protein